MTKHPIVDVAMECVVDSRDNIGEGAFWCPLEQAVYWLDVPMPSRIHRFTPATGEHRTWPMPDMVSAMARRKDGTLLVASQNGLNHFDPRTGAYRHLAAIEPHLPTNRSNDGAPDAMGRFWIGTMQNNLADDGSAIPIAGPAGSLWRIEDGKPPFAAMDDLSITNGVAWSPDSTMLYVVDSMLDRIYVCDFDLQEGTIGPRRVFSDLAGLGTPDGNAVDSEGYLWSARWDGHCVARFAPDGLLDRVVPVPASLVTSCAFGGPDLDVLYITTARLGIDDETARRYPEQGGLFACRPGIRGLERPDYRG